MFFKLFILFLTLQLGNCLENGLARTPPMGWLAWERFTCEVDCQKYPEDCINSHLFETMATRLVEDGYQDVGYEYVNIDDCWSTKERQNDTQQLAPDSHRFPKGINALANHLHDLNLKLGIYGDCGTQTCAGYPAQIKTEKDLQDNYFELDSKTFAEWEVDSFKFDGCNLEPGKAESICPKMAVSLNATNRPVLVICEWPFYMLRDQLKPDYKLAQKSCNAWRYYEDVEDSWLSILNIIDFTIKMQDTIVKYHGPGHWFDPDQLVIGNFALSLDQAEAQMTLWSIWSAPLYMSNDLRKIEPDMAEVLKNRNLISVNQDKLGVFGLMVNQSSDGKIQAFVKPVELVKNGCPSFVIAYFNRYTLGNTLEISFNVRDLLRGSSIEMAANRYSELYDGSSPGGSFTTATCRHRLDLGMTRESSFVSPQLLVRPNGQPNNVALRDASIRYEVYDLIQNIQLESVILNSSLNLAVNPSGVRAVKLVEVDEDNY